ncbi:unannotated protein [freshwater metagenome]|uniref:Unannotated protein n=1 Tax=freshwater metagenome TaxID=449393 RepID=A0A6J6PVT5_9ZZZZ
MQTAGMDQLPFSVHRRPNTRPLVIAHRGACLVAPPNSLAAFAAAIEAGADVAELDVTASLRVGHSEAELASDAPTLDEVLALLAASGVAVHVDMKAEGIERAVVAALMQHDLVGRSVVSTTWPASLRRLVHSNPDVPRALGYPRDRLSVSRLHWPRAVTRVGAAALRSVLPVRLPVLAAISRADVLALHHSMISPKVVLAAHRRGIAVFAWTVNDPVVASRFAAIGVDGIVTDDPAGIRVVLGE